MNFRNMKYLIAVLLMLTVCRVESQMLFTYGTTPVSKEEYLRAFNKNNNGSANDEKAYRDYLELYIRFKLKVKAAYDAKLDTLATQKSELINFRNQIADGFMNDEGIVQSLVTEAFERSQKDIRISHIYIPFTGTDTLSAFKKATEAYKKLQQPRADFATIAETYSEDPSVHVNKGDLGYITTFLLPYELETLAYNTAEGKISKLYKSKTAYHIFKTIAIRPAIGRMKAAQILLAFKPGADSNEKAALKNTADSIYEALQKGASFTAMVTRYSNDNVSYQTGGLMPEFGVGRYNADFENAAFALAKDSDISKPILSTYGYHILKRIERLPVNADKNRTEAMSQLKQSVQADNRIQLAKKALSQKIIKTGGYIKAKYPESLLWTYMDSVYQNRNTPQSAQMNDKTIIFSFPGQKVTAADFARYLNTVKNMPDVMRGKAIPQLLPDYTEVVAMEYYRNNMEKFNKEFAYQLKEFKDGNLLFEIMQQQVWDKAATDSIGLRKYYDNNKNKYWWESSANVIIFTCSDSLSAIKARSIFLKTPSEWRTQVQNADGTLQADSGRFELTQLPVSVGANLKEGFTSEPVKTSTDNIHTFVYIIKVNKERAPRNFEDAKGFVINDYQSFLEDKWIINLKKKYPVKVNETVLKTCWK